MLDRFPTEILHMILGDFCVHCRGEPISAAKHRWGSGIQLYHGQGQKKESKESTYNKAKWGPLDVHALFSLCLVSKRFRDVAQPLLYHAFTLGYGENWHSESYKWQYRLTSFMRTVTRRRDLAAFVETAFISRYLAHGVEDDSDTHNTLKDASETLGIDLLMAWRRREENPSNPERSKVKAVLSSYMDRSSEANRSTKQQDLLRCCLPGELIAMLIALLPNLRSLCLQSSYFGSDITLPYFALRALVISYLPLKVFEADSSFLIALPILELATDLETLNIHKASVFQSWSSLEDDKLDELRIGATLPPMSRLKTLRVTQPRMSETWLGALLSRCTGGLHTFVYEEKPISKSGCVWDVPLTPGMRIPGKRENAPSDLIKHLAGHKHSLKSLYLDFRERQWYESAVPGLGAFGALDDLFISARSWYNWLERPKLRYGIIELLPPNIRSLCLANDMAVEIKRLADELLRLVEVQRHEPKLFPRLQSIDCDVQLMNEDVFIGMGDLFSLVGVDFKFRPCLLTEEAPQRQPRWIRGEPQTASLLSDRKFDPDSSSDSEVDI